MNVALVGLMVFLAVLFALLAWIGPRRIYWAFGAWAHRDPRANEPSDAAYAVRRFGYFAMSAASVAAAIGIAQWQGLFTPEVVRVRVAVEEAAERMADAFVTGAESTDAKAGRFNSQVRSALLRASPPNLELVATHVSGERYTVTTKAGKHPFCLLVRTTPQYLHLPGPESGTITTSYPKLSASVREGACG
ncbi:MULTISPECIES: hypothetical protein [Streptomyces]|uniref:DUF6199 domain-containing protein n=1 Tax=Streptomyces cheonanensis TaxID=312720 RepID=A0ABP5GX90_9ACTN|nr:hypothetical protein [Streptomyces sp. AA0539]